ALFWIKPDGPAASLIWYGWIAAALLILTVTLCALVITIGDRSLIPTPRLATRRGIRSILGISGWNIGILGSQTFGIPAGGILMNLSFGLTAGNLIFGLATQMASYTRMLASGMTGGLDAVSARLS